MGRAQGQCPFEAPGGKDFNNQKWKNMTEIFIIFNSKDTYF